MLRGLDVAQVLKYRGTALGLIPYYVTSTKRVAQSRDYLLNVAGSSATLVSQHLIVM